MDVDAHIDAFNAAVHTNEWSAFVERFTDDAELAFVGVPAGPFVGRAAIADAYAASPPDDTITRIAEPERNGDEEVVRYRWDGTGSTGTMRFTSSPDGRVRKLVISFD